MTTTALKTSLRSKLNPRYFKLQRSFNASCSLICQMLVNIHLGVEFFCKLRKIRGFLVLRMVRSPNDVIQKDWKATILTLVWKTTEQYPHLYIISNQKWFEKPLNSNNTHTFTQYFTKNGLKSHWTISIPLHKTKPTMVWKATEQYPHLHSIPNQQWFPNTKKYQTKMKIVLMC